MAPELQGLDGIPGVSEVFNSFIQTVRLFMRDHPQLNRLVKGEESSDRMIAWAIHDFLSDFAGTPPFLGYRTLEEMFNQHLQAFALRGVAVALFQSIGILQTRNHLQFSDGGISVGVSDKAPMLMQWIRDFQNKYEQQKVQIKVSQNIAQLLCGSPGGVHSELFFVNGWYGIY
jgi:hypothetical protein